MSPEQAEGKTVDHRADVFSFGVVMYEALTGERPFKGDNHAAILGELLKSDPVPVSVLKPTAPFALVRLVRRCLHKSRNQRVQTMREARAILDEIKVALEAGVLSENSSQLGFFKSKNFRLRPIYNSIFTKTARFVLAGLILFAAVAGLSFYYFRPEPPIDFASLTLRKLSQTGNVVYAQITPDGKSIVYITIDENDWRALWIRRVEEKNALQLLLPQPVQFWGIAVSPNGSQIFYNVAQIGARHGTLYRVSPLGGAPRKLVEGVNDLGSLSPDGERILYVRYAAGRAPQQSQILSANAVDGGAERVIFDAKSNHLYHDPQFSADGKQIFFIDFESRNGEEFWSLMEISATGGDERVILAPSKPPMRTLAVLKNGGGLLINKTDEISNLQQLFHVSPADGKLRRLTNDLNFYHGVSASDDGQKIVTTQRAFAKDVRVVPDGDRAQARKLTDESNVYNHVCWTPDGRIVYEATDNNLPHIWTMNGYGTNRQQLTPDDSFDFEPRVSPDGRFIVFTSERTGERKIWRMNIDGSNPQLLTAVAGATFAPVISPNSQTVYFQWANENKKVLGQVPLAGGAVAEQNLFSDNLWAISPDGKQVARVFFDEREKRVKVAVGSIETGDAEKISIFRPSIFCIGRRTATACFTATSNRVKTQASGCSQSAAVNQSRC